MLGEDEESEAVRGLARLYDSFEAPSPRRTDRGNIDGPRSRCMAAYSVGRDITTLVRSHGIYSTRSVDLPRRTRSGGLRAFGRAGERSPADEDLLGRSVRPSSQAVESRCLQSGQRSRWIDQTFTYICFLCLDS